MRHTTRDAERACPKTAVAAMALGLLLLSGREAVADKTATLPAGAFVLDTAYVHSTSRQGYDNERNAISLMKGIKRYEPGGGWQGDIEASPHVVYRLFIAQLLYGVTDQLTVGLAAPMVLDTTIDTRLSWKSGDYQSALGRPYSEEDFWKWAASMGQPKPAAHWKGNNNTLADMVAVLRYRLPQSELMQAWGVDAAVAVQAALPTGTPPDPERLVVAGTTSWDLHSYADVQLHLAVEKSLRNRHGVATLVFGAEAFYGWMRTRTWTTPTGIEHPLLLNYAPYAGKTYELDGGDWMAGTLLVDWAPIVGPTWATFVSGNKMETALKFPPLLTLGVAWNYVATAQTDWTSNSALFDWTGREESWQPGDKNTVIGSATLSLLRVGLPLQFYVRYRNQEILHGRNTRAANALYLGARLLAKFW